MIQGAEHFWMFLSVFCFSRKRQEEVITCWFKNNKEKYRLTHEFSIMTIFVSSISFYECWKETFEEVSDNINLVDHFLSILAKIDVSSLSSLENCFTDHSWEQACLLAHRILEAVNLEPDYSITCIDYLAYIEIWTDDNNNIIGLNR